MSASVISPFYPVIAIFILVVLGIVHLILSWILARYRFLQQKREGYFRFSLIRLKENAEQITFLNGKEVEKEIIESKFEAVMKNQFWLYIVMSLLHGFTSVISEMNGPINIVVILLSIHFGLMDIKGKNDFQINGLIQSYSGVMNSVVSSFMGMLSGMLILGNVIGTVGRVGQLIEKMDEIDTIKSKNTDTVRRRNDMIDRISVENLNGITPTRNKLFSKLSFEVVSGNPTLIRGPSGCGKSSLLRIICGLWDIGPTTNKSKEEESRIYTPNIQDMYFLPQKPYMSPGSLKQQIMYPLEKIDDDEDINNLINQILDEVELRYLVDRLGGLDIVKKEWSNICSPGEQQKIAIARLIFHKPMFAIMDESTASMDEKNESLSYELCFKNGITPVSVGHRISLVEKHNHMIEFTGSGGWIWKKRVLSDGESSDDDQKTFVVGKDVDM